MSYCRICTSSTQSAGNQPVRPFTVPSQNPPSPMLSTRGTEARQAIRRGQSWGPLPPHHCRLRFYPCRTLRPCFPSLPTASRFFLWGDFGIHTGDRNKQKGSAQDGNVGGQACRWTHLRRTEDRGHSCDSAPVTTVPLPSWLCYPPRVTTKSSGSLCYSQPAD